MKIIVKDSRGDLETNVAWTKGLDEAGKEVDLRTARLRPGSNFGIAIDLCGIDLRHRLDPGRDQNAAVGFAAHVTSIQHSEGETRVHCTLADPAEYPYVHEHLSNR